MFSANDVRFEDKINLDQCLIIIRMCDLMWVFDYVHGMYLLRI